MDVIDYVKMREIEERVKGGEKEMTLEQSVMIGILKAMKVDLNMALRSWGSLERDACVKKVIGELEMILASIEANSEQERTP